MLKNRLPALLLATLIGFLMSSCAYMQSNKILKECCSEHIGTELTTTNLSLYSAGGAWYIGAPKSQIKRQYPLFYDSVYGEEEDNSPVEKAVPNTQNGMLYIPISAGTATVLQRADGYSDLQALISESISTGRPATSVLSAAARYPILAKIEKKEQGSTCYIQQTNPPKPSILTKSVCTFDKYTIDVVGTVAYNVTLPFTAPFKFFWKFCVDES